MIAIAGFSGVIKKIDKNIEEDLTSKMEQLAHRNSRKYEIYRGEQICLVCDRIAHLTETKTFEKETKLIAFDGVIYNQKELEQELLNKLDLKTKNVAELVLALFHTYKEKAFSKIRGVFSLAIWDEGKETLYLARDQFGVKPLFYCEFSDGFSFASEKKGLLIEEKLEINPSAFQKYLSFQYVPEPKTMTKNIYKLQPGHYLIKKKAEPFKLKAYTRLSFKTQIQTEEKWVKEIQEVMFDSVERHLSGPQSVGCLLSGGIDSTFLVSIAKEIDPNIKSFSVGFEREGFSEIDLAAETAEALKIENYSKVISPNEYIEILPKLIWHLDDPLADPASIPLYFAAKEAKKHVSSALSGEGADELFGGYNIYREPESLKAFSYFPSTILKLLNKIASFLPDGLKGKSFIERGTTPLEDRYIGNAKIFKEQEKLELIKCYSEDATYQKVTQVLFNEVKHESSVRQMQYVDLNTWLNGDILLKADRMSTANGLEIRTPFLDEKVFNLARGIPTELTLKNKQTKYILRQATRGIVPEQVIDRKKLGFPVPIRHWLKSELYDWAVKLIKESQVDYLIDKQAVWKLYEEHLAGKSDNSRKLWTILVFMKWHAIYIEESLKVTGPMT